MPFRSYVRSLPVSLANSLPWLVVFAGAVWDLLTAPEMRYEHLFASMLLIGYPMMAWIEFTTFWQSGEVKSEPPLATANGPEVRVLESNAASFASEDADRLIPQVPAP